MSEDDREIVLGGTTRSGRVAGRWLATAFDLLVGSYVVGSTLAAAAALDLVPSTVPIGLGLGLLWLALVLVEGVTGRSPGKHVTGINVTRLDGGPTGLRGAAVRRPWIVPLLLVPLGGTVRVAGTLGALVTLLAIGVTTLRDRDGRGLHDWLAATVVVPGTPSRRAPAVTVGVLLLVVLVSAAVRATG